MTRTCPRNSPNCCPDCCPGFGPVPLGSTETGPARRASGVRGRAACRSRPRGDRSVPGPSAPFLADDWPGPVGARRSLARRPAGCDRGGRRRRPECARGGAERAPGGRRGRGPGGVPERRRGTRGGAGRGPHAHSRRSLGSLGAHRRRGGPCVSAQATIATSTATARVGPMAIRTPTPNTRPPFSGRRGRWAAASASRERCTSSPSRRAPRAGRRLCARRDGAPGAHLAPAPRGPGVHQQERQQHPASLPVGQPPKPRPDGRSRKVRAGLAQRPPQHARKLGRLGAGDLLLPLVKRRITPSVHAQAPTSRRHRPPTPAPRGER